VATDSRTIVFQQTSDATFRTWVAAVLDQLNDIGLTQTADTGQIDTATVSTPGAINTSQGYAIFRFNDTLQATKPIYFKIEFGSGTATTTPSIWMTIGTGSDGAGTITGTMLSRVQRSFTGAVTTVNSLANYNASLGVFWANWAAAYSTGSFYMVSIQRTCDYTETPTDQGVLYWTSTSSTTLNLWDFDAGSARQIALHAFPLSTISSTETPYYDSDGYPLALSCQSIMAVGGTVLFPGMYGIHLNHWPPFLTLYLTADATERTFLTMNHLGTPYGYDATGSTNSKLMFLWE
jgi:hypothetical protein